MISRTIALMIAGCLCASAGAAEARTKAKPKRVAALDLSRLAAPADRHERLRDWRVARWTLGDAGHYDDRRDPDAIRWRLRGAGVKMKMPLTLFN